MIETQKDEAQKQFNLSFLQGYMKFFSSIGMYGMKNEDLNRFILSEKVQSFIQKIFDLGVEYSTNLLS